MAAKILSSNRRRRLHRKITKADPGLSLVLRERRIRAVVAEEAVALEKGKLILEPQK